MRHLTQNIGRSSRKVYQALLCCLLFAAVMGAEFFFCASSTHAAGKYLPKRYTLRGDIDLTYEERWSTQEDLDFSRFTHSYDLGLSGFAIDPRLMTFDIETRFSQEIKKPSDNIDLYGFNTALNFFNMPARRGFFSHFPQPIQLTFSYYDSSISSNLNYGISFGYDAFESARVHRQFQQQQQQQQFRRQQQQVNQSSGQLSDENNGQQQQIPVQRQINSRVQTMKFPLPLPILYLDYNKNFYSFTNLSQDLNVDTELLNLRLVDRSTKTEYLAEYDYQRYKGFADITAQFLNIEVNYRNYWKDENKRFESYNRMYLTDEGDVRTLRLRNKNFWDKRLGADLKDNLTITGGGSYYTSDHESNPSNYDINARAQYNKNFNRSWNRASVELGYGDTGEDTIYLARLFDEANYDISRRLSLMGRFTVGKNELGEEYGAGTSMWVRTFINILTRYDFNSIAASEGRTDAHDFGFDLNGRIYKTITFNSRNSYKIREVRGSNKFRDKSLSLRQDVYMPLRRMNINIGASRIEVRKTEGRLVQGEAPVDVEVTSLYSNISAPIARRAFLTMNINYTKDIMQKSYSIRPIINWNIRLLSITAEYELRKTSGENDVTDQRIFFRLTRTFSKNMGGLW